MEVDVTPAEWRPLRLDWFDATDETSPEFAVVVFPVEAPYTVTVEFRRDPDARPFVMGVAVRYQPLWAFEDDFWERDEEERPHVSPRDVQRLPLARIVRAAIAAANSAERPVIESTGKPAVSETARLFADESAEPWKGDPPWAEAARKILVPRGRPERGKSAKFYKDLADSHRAFALAGKSPVKEIARRKGVSENTVHQWVHRARRLGILDPSPRSKQRKEGSSDAS
jgi:hypothetical protein